MRSKLRSVLATLPAVAPLPLVLFVVVLASSPTATAGQIKPPPMVPAHDTGTGHWIRRLPPTPIPTVPIAPLPPVSHRASRQRTDFSGRVQTLAYQQRMPTAAPPSRRMAPGQAIGPPPPPHPLEPLPPPSPATRRQAYDALPFAPSPLLQAPLTPQMQTPQPRLVGGDDDQRGRIKTPPVAVALDEMTLADLEAIALQHNPTLMQAQAKIDAALGTQVQVRLYPNPRIGYTGGDIGALGTAGKQGAFLGQEFITAGKLQRREAVAAQEVTELQQACESQRYRVLNDVRSAGYDTLVAQRVVTLNRQLVAIGEQGVKAASDLLAALEVSRVDLLQAQIESESAKLKLHDAETRYRAAWRRLAALIGTPDMEPMHLAGDLEDDLPQLTWQTSLERVLAESPELAQARVGVCRALCNIALQNVEWIPNVDVRAKAEYDVLVEGTIAGVEVELPLPLFNRNQGNIHRAQAQLIVAKREVERLALALQERLATVYERYASACNNVEHYATRIIPNAKTSLDLVQIGYRQGEYDYLTLLTAQRTYFQTSLAYLESLRRLHASSVSIEGLLLQGGLSMDNFAEGAAWNEP